MMQSLATLILTKIIKNKSVNWYSMLKPQKN